MAVTIYDLAKHAGVSIATVSRVLNGSPRLSAATRERVIESMGVLGYKPNSSARRLASGGDGRRRVAVLLPMFSAHFFHIVGRSLAAGLVAADCDLQLHDVEDRASKQRVLDHLVATRDCHGIVLVSMGVGSERQEQLRRIGLPVVGIDHPQTGIPTVGVDNRALGREAASILSERGVKKPILVAWSQVAATLSEREIGIAEIFPNILIVRTSTIEVASAQLAVQKNLADADGVIGIADPLAVGALQAARSLKRDVPGAIQILGFDDLPFMDVLGLSTMRQPMAEMGTWAAQAIVAAMDAPDETIPSLILPCTPCLRATTR